MARNTTYTVKQFVPDENGGWRDLKDLTPEEYENFRDGITAGLAEAVKEIFIKRPEFFEHCCKAGLVTGIKRR